MTSRAVFTALFGRYEALAEQPVAATSGIPFICFTDDPDLTSETWDVRVVTPAFDLDPTRSARSIKIGGHPDLATYDETLWVDARVLLRTDPHQVLDAWLDGTDLATTRHSYRADVVSEFEEVLVQGLDESARLYEQLTHYSTTAPELLQAPVPWTALLARRHRPEVERAMAEWLLHVVRYSRRDQLSFVHTMARAGIEPRLVDLDNHLSEVHQWLGIESRSGRRPVYQVSQSLRPPTAELGELRLRLEQVTSSMVAAVAAREERIEELENQLVTVREQLAKRQQKVRQLRAKLNAERRR